MLRAPADAAEGLMRLLGETIREMREAQNLGLRVAAERLGISPAPHRARRPVKGYAAQESKVLTDVIEARAKATQMQIPPDVVTNPEAFKKLQEVQGQLLHAAKANSHPQSSPSARRGSLRLWGHELMQSARNRKADRQNRSCEIIKRSGGQKTDARRY